MHSTGLSGIRSNELPVRIGREDISFYRIAFDSPEQTRDEATIILLTFTQESRGILFPSQDKISIYDLSLPETPLAMNDEYNKRKPCDI